MSIFSEQDLERRVRRNELEGRGRSSTDTESLQRQITDLQHRLTTDPANPDPREQGIFQMLRNTDHNHSVNTWWEAAVSGTDKDLECANVYCFDAINPITITDAAITTGTPDLSSPSNPFTAAMAGRYVQVAGAGAAGATLIALVSAFVDAGHVTLDTNAGTTVAAAQARINLQKLGHTNKKNSAGTNPNDALKDAAHSQITGLTAISDPDWKKDRGIVRLGSKNVVGYSFGRFDNTGLNYVPLHMLQSGREPYFRLNIVRANRYVKIRGRLFVGIYNNDTDVLDWIHGSNLALEASLNPNPPVSTINTDYMVVLETGQGMTIVSDIKNVANAPDDTAIAGGNTLTLSWLYYAGVQAAKIYRRRAGGNVYLMETFSTGANTWTDTNLSTRTDTGSLNFPSFSNQISAVPSYWASADDEFDEVPYDGEPERFWRPITGWLPFSQSVNMANVFDPFFVVGLTEAPSTYLTDAVAIGTNVVDSAAGQFSAAMNGKTYILTKADGSASVQGVVTFVNANRITVSVMPTWSEAGSTLEILESQPRGLLYDLVGVSFNQGEWDFHAEDNSEMRGQAVASNPNGSTQGGTGGQSPTQRGGRGGIDCVLDEAMVTVRGRPRTGIICRLIDRWRAWRKQRPLGSYRTIELRAIDIDYTDLLWDGHGFEAENFNEIDWISVKYVDKIRRVRAQTRELPCTAYHRLTDGPQTYRNGLAVGGLTQGRIVLISDRNSLRVEQVSDITPETGHFRVVSFGLKTSARPTACLLVVNGFVSHNRKLDEPILVQ
jgi:hypothetical protein